QGHVPRRRAMTRAWLGGALLGLAGAVACNQPPSPPSPASSSSPSSQLTAQDAGAPLGATAPETRGTAGGSAPAAPAVEHGPPRVVVLPEPALELPKQESFRLIDPGKRPRAPLRYALAPGATAVVATTTLASRHLEAGAFTAPVQLPAIRDGFAVTVPEPPGGAAAPVALAGLPGTAARPSRDADAYLAAWRTLLEGRRAALAFDERGGFTAQAFDEPAGGASRTPARDELVGRLLSMTVPVPVEPVGIGARWRVVTILRQHLAVAKQTATYTLIARGPAGWKLHVALQRVGEQQPIADPALPAGTSAELIALFRALEGDVEVDPGLPLIAGGALAVESRLHARLHAAGQPSVDQMFEDTGRVRFSRCRPVATPAASAAPAHGRPLAACPDGVAR
ncbi:MAG TPA: hypothetical protein VFT22_31485, partial [Kofleriaceae bacterium]|nr:hypothetical protein [Kofleriaceae bacterium]